MFTIVLPPYTHIAVCETVLKNLKKFGKRLFLQIPHKDCKAPDFFDGWLTGGTPSDAQPALRAFGDLIHWLMGWSEDQRRLLSKTANDQLQSLQSKDWGNPLYSCYAEWQHQLGILEMLHNQQPWIGNVEALKASAKNHSDKLRTLPDCPICGYLHLRGHARTCDQHSRNFQFD
jgi:hypothetical protein